MSSVPRVVETKVIIARYGKKIMERHFLDPDGVTRDFLLWGGETIPTIVLPVTVDKKVIALQIFRRAANKLLIASGTPLDIWSILLPIEIPGGNCKNGETDEDCVRRELREETGYAAEKIIQVGPSIWFDPASCFTPYMPFLALDCQKIQKQEVSETEIQETMKIVLAGLSEWVNMIYRGAINDSKTVAVTFLALPYLGVNLAIGNTLLG